MSQLRLLYEDTVTGDEIDRNGHLNVRFYSARATRATQALAESLGLDASACRQAGVLLLVTDAFTRYRREQLVGAHLAVRSGVIGVAADRLRLYHELSNRETEELAATFVHETRLLDRQSGAFVGLPESLGHTLADVVPWPDRGRPRTLGLDHPPKVLALAEARRRGLALRQNRTITADECDSDGLLLPEPQADLFWGDRPARGRSEEPFRGWRPGFGWVTLESRTVSVRLPRVGTRIQSYGAEVDVGRKTTHRRHWAFDVDRGDVVAVTSMINLGFDVVARRSREIPLDVRRELEADHHPDLL
jgi:acyl-CoA thioester hydrolase